FRQQMGLRDPKRAIRIGMARQWRITKFQVGNTQPLEPSVGKTIMPRAAERLAEKGITLLRHRCEACALEGLRQLGYLPEPIGFEFNGQAQLPHDMVVAGLWMLRLTRKRSVVR